MTRHIPNVDRANRILRMLSRINRCIVRADSPDGLYHDVCHAAIECGLFQFAWIGLVDSHSGQIRLMASHGSPWCDEDMLVAPGGLADIVRQAGRLCIYNDPLTLPAESGSLQMVRHGMQALAGLPLHEGQEPVGVFMLYTGQTECFDDTVVDLLQEVADDIAYSLENMHEQQRRLAMESRLYYMAFYDAQTGLPNRELLEERLNQLTRSAGSLAMLVIRLLRLDKMAEIHGRLTMDAVLRCVVQRLESWRGQACLLAQTAQDEFVLVSPELHDTASVAALAQQVLRLFQEPVRIDEQEIFLYPTIGAAVYPLHEKDSARLLRRARVAAAGADSEGGFRFYSADMDRGLEQRIAMEAELHRALERGEFELFYQPQLNLQTGCLTGVEALLRWRHPKRGLVPPDLFISLLEECGLMPAVGGWVTRTACRQARAWQEQAGTSIRIAVNVSALQFRRADFVPMVADTLRETGLDARCLELELTESLILENVEQTIAAMHALKELGVCLALDDFGTGYSSLSYLRRYPIDRLKIDRSFVHEMMEHANSEALVRSILAMAVNLGLTTIAEGVETEAQRDWLRLHGCEEMQGFLFSCPVPADEISLILSGRRLV